MNELGSLCFWKPGHAPTVDLFRSRQSNHPHKDYSEIQDRYALVGTRELVVFDPFLAGPSALGGPLLLQYGVATAPGCSSACYAGDSPTRPRRLARGSFPRQPRSKSPDDREGLRRWLNWEELAAAEQAATQHERAEKERERAEKERERAEKERERAARLELERRIAEIEAKVGGR